jgi:hypothetical protein
MSFDARNPGYRGTGDQRIQKQEVKNQTYRVEGREERGKGVIRTF